MLRVAQLTPELDAELLGQGSPGVLVGLERLRLAAGPIEGEHELAAQPLPQWMLGDECLQLAGEGVVAAVGEICSIRRL